MGFIKKERIKFNKKYYSSFILGGDIGGTNANFGIFGVKKSFPELLVHYHFESRRLKDTYSAITAVLDDAKKDYGINVSIACLGVAGAVSPGRDFVHLTNAKLDLAAKKLERIAKLKNVMLMNDFEAVGYGINMLSKNDFKTIKKAAKIPKYPVVVVGAGTGLGKTLLLYNEKGMMYVPIPSEAHHSDFPAQNGEELGLVDFIKKQKRIKRVGNGDVLSGEGLASIYNFLRKNKKFNATSCTREIDRSKSKPEMISKYRKIDKTCKAAFHMFKAAYANFAKNMALDALAFGGVYIAGGIAPKNREIFDSEFVKMFEYSPKMGHVLKRMPVYLILNHNIGLLGAGFFGARQK